MAAPEQMSAHALDNLPTERELELEVLLRERDDQLTALVVSCYGPLQSQTLSYSSSCWAWSAL